MNTRKCIFCKLKEEGYKVTTIQDRELAHNFRPFKENDYVKITYNGKDRTGRFSHYSKHGKHGFVKEDKTRKLIKKPLDAIEKYEPEVEPDIGGFDIETDEYIQMPPKEFKKIKVKLTSIKKAEVLDFGDLDVF